MLIALLTWTSSFCVPYSILDSVPLDIVSIVGSYIMVGYAPALILSLAMALKPTFKSDPAELGGSAVALGDQISIHSQGKNDIIDGRKEGRKIVGFNYHTSRPWGYISVHKVDRSIITSEGLSSPLHLLYVCHRHTPA